MKSFILSMAFAIISLGAFAQRDGAGGKQKNSAANVQPADTVTLLIDGLNNNTAYYQKVVKVDSITEPQIYLRAIQFMASKNFQQNYGYQEEGKLIFTTAQDLNINAVYVDDDDDALEPYTVQFAFSLDIKNGSYRYTINNVVFFIPDGNGNKRETLYDVYLKSTNTDSKRIAKATKKLLASFEKYLTTLTGELYQGIEQKSLIYKKF